MEFQIAQRIQRGREAYTRGEYLTALQEFRAVLEKHPAYADIRNLAGLCLGFLGQPEAALEEFDRALEVNGAYIEAWLNRSIVLNELGRYDEARESFERAGKFEREGAGRFVAAASARLANAHAEVGDLYMAASAPAEAAEQYRKALALRPRFHDIRTKLALALVQLGDLDGAETELKSVLESNPTFVAARLHLGLVYFRCGLLAEASAQWKAAHELAPENPQARAYLSMLERNEAPYDSSGP